MRARCAASAAFALALPGGAWLGRGPDEPAGAYAVFTLELDGDPEFCSDGSYTQGYVLRVGAYSYQGDGAATAPQATQSGMAAALNRDPTDWDALRDGRVLHCLPKGYDGRFDERLREGRDVFVSGGRWVILIEGDLEP